MFMESNSVQFLRKREYNPVLPSFPLSYNRSTICNNLGLFVHDVYGHYGCVNAVEFSKDHQYFASGGDDKRILFWNIEKTFASELKPVTLQAVHNSNIFCIGFDSQTRSLFSSGNDEQVIHHDLIKNTAKNVFLYDDAIYGLSVNPSNDNMFCVACEDGQILMTDSRVVKDSVRIASYTSPFHAVMFHPIEHNYLVSANTKEGIGLWDVRKPGSCLFRYESRPVLGLGLPPLIKGELGLRESGCVSNNNKNVMCAKFSQDGNFIMALTRRQGPLLYLSNDYILKHGHNQDVIKSTSDVLTSSYLKDSYHRFLNQPVCKFDHTTYYNSCTMKSGCFAGVKDEFVVSGSDDFNVYVWKIPDCVLDLNIPDEVPYNPDPYYILQGHRSIVNQTRFDPTRNCLISSGVEKIIKIWTPYPLGLKIKSYLKMGYKEPYSLNSSKLLPPKNSYCKSTKKLSISINDDSGVHSTLNVYSKRQPRSSAVCPLNSSFCSANSQGILPNSITTEVISIPNNFSNNGNIEILEAPHIRDGSQGSVSSDSLIADNATDLMRNMLGPRFLFSAFVGTDVEEPSLEEDTGMLAFFDSLLQHELEGWESASTSSSSLTSEGGGDFGEDLPSDCYTSNSSINNYPIGFKRKNVNEIQGPTTSCDKRASKFLKRDYVKISKIPTFIRLRGEPVYYVVDNDSEQIIENEYTGFLEESYRNKATTSAFINLNPIIPSSTINSGAKMTSIGIDKDDIPEPDRDFLNKNNNVQTTQVVVSSCMNIVSNYTINLNYNDKVNNTAGDAKTDDNHDYEGKTLCINNNNHINENKFDNNNNGDGDFNKSGCIKLINESNTQLLTMNISPSFKTSSPVSETGSLCPRQEQVTENIDIYFQDVDVQPTTTTFSSDNYRNNNYDNYISRDARPLVFNDSETDINSASQNITIKDQSSLPLVDSLVNCLDFYALFYEQFVPSKRRKFPNFVTDTKNCGKNVSSNQKNHTSPLGKLNRDPKRWLLRPIKNSCKTQINQSNTQPQVKSAKRKRGTPPNFKLSESRIVKSDKSDVEDVGDWSIKNTNKKSTPYVNSSPQNNGNLTSSRHLDIMSPSNSESPKHQELLPTCSKFNNDSPIPKAPEMRDNPPNNSAFLNESIDDPQETPGAKSKLVHLILEKKAKERKRALHHASRRRYHSLSLPSDDDDDDDTAVPENTTKKYNVIFKKMGQSKSSNKSTLKSFSKTTLVDADQLSSLDSLHSSSSQSSTDHSAQRPKARKTKKMKVASQLSHYSPSQNNSASSSTHCLRKRPKISNQSSITPFEIIIGGQGLPDDVEQEGNYNNDCFMTTSLIDESKDPLLETPFQHGALNLRPPSKPRIKFNFLKDLQKSATSDDNISFEPDSKSFPSTSSQFP